MSLVEHLTELRRRVIVSVIAISLGAVVAFVLYDRILGFLIRPYEDITGRSTLLITDPLEGFTTRLKIAAFGGLVLASPVVLWEAWRFITPGLHKREKRYAIPFILSSIVLFLAGAALATFTFENALRFLVAVGGENLEAFFTPARYLNLIVLMMVAFGVAFLFPVVLVFLQLARVLTSRRLRSWRRPAILVIVIAAAVITPTQDPYSLFAMVLPMYLFYEGAILIGRLLKR
ncbi:MAG TPA: twin-arginine translocase subunit TatC [Acidimicrobiales bacterium]|nr:twin-arginine translocase subunit TatC [Acidimicrobiales bacterium]